MASMEVATSFTLFKVFYFSSILFNFHTYFILSTEQNIERAYPTLSFLSSFFPPKSFSFNM